MKREFAATVITAFVVFASACMANEIVDLQIVSESSSVTANVNLQSNLPGSLIGNFDAKTNPTGTMTRPGLFGGSGNQPIDLDMTGNLTGGIESQPIGSYRLELDVEALTVSITDFELDLLGGEAGVLALSVDLAFDTFRTFQPDSLYLGIPITLPLGDGSLTVLSLQQAGPAPSAALMPEGSNLYSFTLLVPALIAIESEIFGQPVNPGLLPTAIMLAGTIEVDGEQVTVTQTFGQMVNDTITDIPGGDFTDLPLDLPTILPPGGTAQLLLSGTIDSISYDLDLTAALTANGQFSSILLGDLNGDGIVSLLDVQPFVDALTGGIYLPAADINQDGVVNLQDIAPFVALLI